MSTTTALELLERADLLTRSLRRTEASTTLAQWEAFDVTLHRVLLEIIGIDGRHVRTADPSWRAMQSAVATYPAPLRPPVGTRLQPSYAARYTGTTAASVRFHMRAGHLRVVRDEDAGRVPTEDLDQRADIRPADPLDPHPLARLSCTLGALGDLIRESRDHGPEVLTGGGEVAGAALHVLSLAAVAARHVVAHGRFEEAERPVLVGRYAERVIDALRDVALQPASLDQLSSVAVEPQPVALNDRLEAALAAWTKCTEDELQRLLPSVDVLRQVANQGAHLSDVRALLEVQADSERAVQLNESAEALRQGERAWDRLTTLTRPSHEFVTASRDLFESLREVARAVAAIDQQLDCARATVDLDRGLGSVAALMTATRTLPERLVNANVLRAPAASIRSTDDRLHERARGRHVQVRPADVPDLTALWRQAAIAIEPQRNVSRGTQRLSLSL